MSNQESNNPGWGSEANTPDSNAPSTTSPSSGGTYTDNKGNPISREQAIGSGVIDSPGSAGSKAAQIGLSGGELINFVKANPKEGAYVVASVGVVKPPILSKLPDPTDRNIIHNALNSPYRVSDVMGNMRGNVPKITPEAQEKLRNINAPPRNIPDRSDSLGQFNTRQKAINQENYNLSVKAKDWGYKTDESITNMFNANMKAVGIGDKVSLNVKPATFVSDRAANLIGMKGLVETGFNVAKYGVKEPRDLAKSIAWKEGITEGVSSLGGMAKPFVQGDISKSVGTALDFAVLYKAGEYVGKIGQNKAPNKFSSGLDLSPEPQPLRQLLEKPSTFRKSPIVYDSPYTMEAGRIGTKPFNYGRALTNPTPVIESLKTLKDAPKDNYILKANYNPSLSRKSTEPNFYNPKNYKAPQNEYVPTREQFMDLKSNPLKTAKMAEKATGKPYDQLRGVELMRALEEPMGKPVLQTTYQKQFAASQGNQYGKFTTQFQVESSKAPVKLMSQLERDMVISKINTKTQVRNKVDTNIFTLGLTNLNTRTQINTRTIPITISDIVTSTKFKVDQKIAQDIKIDTATDPLNNRYTPNFEYVQTIASKQSKVIDNVVKSTDMFKMPKPYPKRFIPKINTDDILKPKKKKQSSKSGYKLRYRASPIGKASVNISSLTKSMKRLLK